MCAPWIARWTSNYPIIFSKRAFSAIYSTENLNRKKKKRKEKKEELVRFILLQFKFINFNELPDYKKQNSK
jgi:hypothetical protein